MISESRKTRFEPIKVALTLNQIEELALPPVMTAKEDDATYDRFVERYGETVYELEAVEPSELQQILTHAIDSVIDVKSFNAEIDREKEDSAYLHGIRRTVNETLKSLNLGGATEEE